MSFLEKCLSRSLFFNWIVCLPGVELCEFFMYFGDQTLVQDIIGKHIFPYSWFPFHFANVLLSHAEAFYFDEVPFILSFMSLALGDILVKILLRGISEAFPPMFPSKTFILSQLIVKFLSMLSLFFCMV